MPFLAINFANAYDALNQQPYLTRKEADDRATDLLNEFPKAKVVVVEVLAEYEAKVTVTSKAPTMPSEEPAPAE